MDQSTKASEVIYYENNQSMNKPSFKDNGRFDPLNLMAIGKSNIGTLPMRMHGLRLVIMR